MRAGTVALLMCVAARTAFAMKFADSEQGAAFDKCISVVDFNTKTLDDDVEVVDREASGCCPDGTLPGAKYYATYQGAQIVCGFKEDGTAAISTGSSNGEKTCTYNSCYVQKQGLSCKEDTKQLLNGCCGATKDARTFKDGCLSYDYTLKTVYKNEYEYCLSYDKDYGTKGWVGTAEATDDQADGKLVVKNLYTYTPCEGGAAGGGGSDASTTNVADSAVRTTAGVIGIMGAVLMA